MRKSGILKPFLIRFVAVFGFIWLVLEAGTYFEVQPLILLKGKPHYFGVFLLVSAIISIVLTLIKRRLVSVLIYAILSTQVFVTRRGRDQFQSVIEAVRSGQTASKEFLESTLAKSATYIKDAINLNFKTHILSKKEVSRLRYTWDQANLLSSELKRAYCRR